MRFSLLFSIIALLIISSCQKQANHEMVESDSNNFRILEEIIEDFDNSGESSIIKVVYTYSEPTSIYWTEAKFFIENQDSIIKTITRENCQTHGTPIHEIVQENGNQIESIYYDYDMKLDRLKSIEYYKGKFEDSILTKRITYDWTDDGFVTKETIEKFCNDPGFINSEGTKLKDRIEFTNLPDTKSRAKGLIMPVQMMTYRKKYNVDNKSEKFGKIDFEVKTEFGKDGFPIHYVAGEPDCEDDAAEEWFKVEKDDKGRLISLIGFADKEFSKVDEKNFKRIFGYDTKGKLTEYSEMRYNSNTKKYSDVHNRRKIKWVVPFGEGTHSLADIEEYGEAYCIGRMVHSEFDRRISKLDTNTKVIEEYYGESDGDYGANKIEKKLAKRITQRIQKIERNQKSKNL